MAQWELILLKQEFFLVIWNDQTFKELSKILTLNGNFGETKGLVIKRETGKDVLIEIPEFAPEHYATALAIMNKVE